MTFLAKGQENYRGELERALSGFAKAGAEFIDVPTLLPADIMLEIYGEEIRNRAYIVHDGVEGDFVLRPDFTVPIVQEHMKRETTQARYAYSGRVWRKQRHAARQDRQSFWQAGIEFFDQNRHAENDAEIFALASNLAAPHGFEVKTGDLSLIFSLLDQIEMSEARRRALKRQFWRPRAFERLLERYSTKGGKRMDFDQEISAAIIGLRDETMIRARIERLEADAKEAPLNVQDIEALRRVLDLRNNLAVASQELGDIAKDYPALAEAASQFEARNVALKALGVDIANVAFDASFGRATMEYYDGFVFSHYAGEKAVIAGGRYDSLAQSFGADRALSAVGMAYRPELVEA